MSEPERTVGLSTPDSQAQVPRQRTGLRHICLRCCPMLSTQQPTSKSFESHHLGSLGVWPCLVSPPLWTQDPISRGVLFACPVITLSRERERRSCFPGPGQAHGGTLCVSRMMIASSFFWARLFPHRLLQDLDAQAQQYCCLFVLLGGTIAKDKSSRGHGPIIKRRGGD